MTPVKCVADFCWDRARLAGPVNTGIADHPLPPLLVTHLLLEIDAGISLSLYPRQLQKTDRHYPVPWLT